MNRRYASAILAAVSAVAVATMSASLATLAALPPPAGDSRHIAINRDT